MAWWTDKSILSIDLETYAEVDIGKAGTYKYAENAQILLMAYAFDDEQVQIVDLTQGEEMPRRLYHALYDPDVLKTAYNAAFEINVINHYLELQGAPYGLNPEQWLCTMVLGFSLGLPGGLDRLGKALHLPEDKQKLSTGKRLIQYFSKPCKPTKTNGGRTRNLPEHEPEKWELFKEYCKQDVEAERALRKRMQKYFPSQVEHLLWTLDQQINSRGVLVDTELVDAAIALDDEIKEEALISLKKLTALDNPNSNKQFLEWFESQEGYTPSTLDKNARKALLKDDGIKVSTRHAIGLKETISKTSVKKYEAMKNMMCRDGRVKGMLQFYGAQRTGRWAGRGVQLQNLPQNHLDDIADVRELVKMSGPTKDLSILALLYSNPSEVLSQLIRTAFIAPKGSRFIVADFSAIEARVIAWIADEQWRMDVFANGGDIYCESASQMFKVPVVKHGINGELRQKGKVAELACGYGGGVNALKAFGADKLGMSEEDMQRTIDQWRQASPHICQLWRDLEVCAKKAIRLKTRVGYKKGIAFSYENGILFMQLPSGRRIAYVRPRIELEDEYGRETLTYEGTATTGGWGRLYTWGGKLTENLVQATARDCLAVSMLSLDLVGYKIVMHVHDEVIIEAPYKDGGSLENVIGIMGAPIPWAQGLLLRADGYETEFYMKD